MPRSVLLRHDLPDGSWHLDWLIERAERLGGEAGDRTVMTFRLDRRPDEIAESIEAEEMPDHRRLYLDYEGVIAGGRGSVSRVAEWRCEVLHVTPNEIHVRLEGDSGAVTLCGVAVEGRRSAGERRLWRFGAV
jgi:hypothetical protein